MSEEAEWMARLGQALQDAADPNKSDEEKMEGFFSAMFGHEEHDDIKMHQKYDWHPANPGLLAGQVIEMKVCGLFEGRVNLLGNGITATHSVDEFRDLIGKGTYVKKS